jgi:hypothetical protein
MSEQDERPKPIIATSDMVRRIRSMDVTGWTEKQIEAAATVVEMPNPTTLATC